MDDAVERKLTTILAADVKGYSRLMDADEVATLAMLKSYRGAMVGLIERHRGRALGTAGDSLLAEFASVVEAVQCAVEIQRELKARNQALPDDRRMEFRVGLNLGDVMVDDNDLYGEGVNIAARLQALAEPGGIYISGTVYDQVRNKLTVGYDFLGERSIKNISEHVPVYRVLLEPDAGHDQPRERPKPGVAPPEGETATERKQARHHRFYRRAARIAFLIAVLFVIDLLTGGPSWFWWPALGLGCYIGWQAVDTFVMTLFPAGRTGHQVAHRRRGEGDDKRQGSRHRR